LGVYDLPVTETLWRLTELGDLGVDAGANIGYTASVLAVRAGPAGLVVAFEPHPVLRAELAANIARWAGCAAVPVDVRGCALSAAPGTLALVEGDAFAAMSAQYSRARRACSLSGACATWCMRTTSVVRRR
jgi:FkbM family methyltransferase